MTPDQRNQRVYADRCLTLYMQMSCACLLSHAGELNAETFLVNPSGRHFGRNTFFGEEEEKLPGAEHKDRKQVTNVDGNKMNKLKNVCLFKR